MKLRQGNLFTPVSHSVHRGGMYGGRCVWQGACMVGGMQSCVCVGGGGMHGRDCAWQGRYAWQGWGWGGGYVAGETATAAGGMHLLDCILVVFVN